MTGKMDKGQNEFSFVTEHIQKPRMSRKAFFFRVLRTLFLAVLFGGAAAVTFAFVLPIAQSGLESETSARESITIPRDEFPSEETESLPSETESLSDIQESSTEPIEHIVQEMLEEKVYTVEDYVGLYDALYQVVTQVNRSIVNVISVESSVDWFDRPYETQGETSGIVYNKTREEILILTDAGSIHNADDIRITFADGINFQGELRKLDVTTGMAVIAVDTAQMEEVYLERIVTVSLGNSHVVRVGDPVIAVGNPFGYTYSMSYGMVSAVKNIAKAVDCNLRLINTNILEGATGSGFLINLKGEIVGLITKEYKSGAPESVTTAIAISDLKGTLERLSNGEDMVYFGMYGQEVTLDISTRMGLPLGVYVTETVPGSPVYEAGIQSGDVIVALDDQEMRSMRILRTFLESCQDGDEVQVRAMRRGREEYKEIEFTVVLRVNDAK